MPLGRKNPGEADILLTRIMVRRKRVTGSSDKSRAAGLSVRLLPHMYMFAVTRMRSLEQLLQSPIRAR